MFPDTELAGKQIESSHKEIIKQIRSVFLSQKLCDLMFDDKPVIYNWFWV